MSNGPNDRKQNTTATQQINQNDHVTPGQIFPIALLALLQNNASNVGQNLQGNHHHKQLFILGGQHVFDESPTGTNQHQNNKQKCSFQ